MGLLDTDFLGYIRWRTYRKLGKSKEVRVMIVRSRPAVVENGSSDGQRTE